MYCIGYPKRGLPFLNASMLPLSAPINGPDILGVTVPRHGSSYVRHNVEAWFNSISEAPGDVLNQTSKDEMHRQSTTTCCSRAIKKRIQAHVFLHLDNWFLRVALHSFEKVWCIVSAAGMHQHLVFRYNRRPFIHCHAKKYIVLYIHILY